MRKVIIRKIFCKGTRHEGRSWEEVIWHISCSVMTRQLILWVSFFVHGSQKERKREVLVLVMVKWYLESSWASTSIWAALFLFFCYFYKYWGQEKSFSAFLLFHLFGIPCIGANAFTSFIWIFYIKSRLLFMVASLMSHFSFLYFSFNSLECYKGIKSTSVDVSRTSGCSLSSVFSAL